tara:strand:- start:129 stop:908 length:780 start_codon:yes stop_codon:yes gene_type:complete
MDLGLKGKKAIVCASSKGLGKSCAKSLLEEGVEVIINSRSEENLDNAFNELSEIAGAKISKVVSDLNCKEGQEMLISSCPEADILITNNGGPPPGNFLDFNEKDWISAYNSNFISAINLIQAVVPGMRERKFGRIINITSAMVKSPNPLMALSTSARAGLTAVSKGLSKEVAKDNVTINNLLPERFDTERQFMMANLIMETKGVTMEEAKEEIASTITAHRLGDPEEFGKTCAFICSIHAGFISGQNIQLDGASYEGLI